MHQHVHIEAQRYFGGKVHAQMSNASTRRNKVGSVVPHPDSMLVNGDSSDELNSLVWQLVAT